MRIRIAPLVQSSCQKTILIPTLIIFPNPFFNQSYSCNEVKVKVTVSVFPRSRSTLEGHSHSHSHSHSIRQQAILILILIPILILSLFFPTKISINKINQLIRVNKPTAPIFIILLRQLSSLDFLQCLAFLNRFFNSITNDH